MGVSIYPVCGLVDEIHSYIFTHQLEHARANRVTDSDHLTDFINDVLDKFGFVTDDGKYFITCYNEYFEEYNAGSQIHQFFSRYFGLDPDEDYEISFELPIGGLYYCGGSADDVADDLGVELIEFNKEEGY